MRKLKLFTINALYKRMLKKRYTSFMACLSESKTCQSAYLQNLVRKNRDTAYGRACGFNKIRTVSEYRKTVPLNTYENIHEYVVRMKKGEPNVLFSDPLLMFEKTSGSTAASKYIPFNRTLLEDIHRGTSAWIYDVYHQFENLTKTSAYWSISPRMGAQEYTEAGIKVGFADDSEYFSPMERKFLKHVLTVDPKLCALDQKEFQRETAVCLICDENLGLISIWNPTLFVLFLEYIEANRDALIKALTRRPGCVSIERLGYLKTLFNEASPIDFQSLWPNLQLISCWTDGASSLFLPSLLNYFPDIPIQGKGLFMTEGIITIPMRKLPFPVLCVNSHFYEFLEVHGDMDAGFADFEETRLPHELEISRTYVPVLTTGGGLYRYITGDRVMVKGFYKDVPLLKFLGRLNHTVDLFGEKLNELFVEKALVRLNKKHGLNPEFFMVAPTLTPKPHYVYFIEERENPLDVRQMEDELEKCFCENHHYNLCRKLGQLESVEVLKITRGRHTYVQAMMDIKRQKYGDIKNKVLDSSLFWKENFVSSDACQPYADDSPNTVNPNSKDIHP